MNSAVVGLLIIFSAFGLLGSILFTIRHYLQDNRKEALLWLAIGMVMASVMLGRVFRGIRINIATSIIGLSGAILFIYLLVTGDRK